MFSSRIEGSNARALVAHAGLDSNASFSADGQWVAFTSQRSGPSKIFRVHTDGSGLEQITDGDAFDDQAAFSPDAKSIAFVSTRSGQADVWILDLATHGLRNLTSSATGEFRPSWSAHGQWIAFSTDRNPTAGPCLGGAPPGAMPALVRMQSTSVYIVHPDGSGLRRVSGPERLAVRRAGQETGPRCCSTTQPSKTRAAQARFATALKLRKFSRSTSGRGSAQR